MSTIQIKNSFTRVQEFMKGGNILSDIYDMKVYKAYHEYLISLNNKDNTIFRKLRFIYLLEQYLVSVKKNFETFSKENIYCYFDECSKLS